MARNEDWTLINDDEHEVLEEEEEEEQGEERRVCEATSGPDGRGPSSLVRRRERPGGAYRLP